MNNYYVSERTSPIKPVITSTEAWLFVPQNIKQLEDGTFRFDEYRLKLPMDYVVPTDVAKAVCEAQKETQITTNEYLKAYNLILGNNATVDMERVRELRSTITQNAQAAQTDEEALVTPELYDEWDGNAKAYKAGRRFRYNGILYKVLQDHTSQETWTPDVTASLYTKVLIPDETVIPEWEQPESTNGYMTGDKVTHNGMTYESLVDNNVWEPGAAGTESLWEAV